MEYEYIQLAQQNQGQSQGQSQSQSQSQRTGRPRGRSLLQNIANEHKTEDKRDESIPPQREGSKQISEPNVPRRRAHSLAAEKSELDVDVKGAYVTTPLTRVQRSLLVRRCIGEESEDDAEEDDDELDDIDWANMQKYTDFKQQSELYSRSCAKLLDQSSTITHILDELTLGFEQVRDDTNDFEQTCDKAISEYDHSSQLLENIDKNLAFFTRLEKATRMLNSPGSDLVVKPQFQPLLKDLDEGLSYVERHPTFKDIDLYQMRYRQCMTRALTLAQTYFCNKMRDVTAKIQPQVSAKQANATTQQALLYSRFERDSDILKPLTIEVGDRYESHQEYYGLFSQCLYAFFAARDKLLAPIIPKHFEETANVTDLNSFASSCLSYYKTLCNSEHALFDKFFTKGHEELETWLVSLCERLYDALRQRIIRENDIDTLCGVTSTVLSYSEYVTDQVDYSKLFQPVLQDVQSRLLFRVNSVVDAEIVKYMPTPEDLSLGHRRRASKNGNSARSDVDTEELFKGWYTPMRRAILLLSQIYHLVNSAVFDDMAHHILHECLGNLGTAHKLALVRLGDIEGQLYMIKQLLLLNQQISGFDIDTTPAETAIDFSGLQDAFATLRQGGVSFSGQTLLNLARESVPKVVNDMLDAKEELYAKLKNAIHDFTEAVVQSMVKSIVNNPEPEKAVEATRQLRQDCSQELPRIYKIIASYIDNSLTINTLIDSIKDLVVQTYERYEEQVVKAASQSEDPTDQLNGMMGEEGLRLWLDKIVTELHSDKNVE